ncbi:NUDIX domain-containing protein [Ancylobacter dichloromethanicus]
MFGELADRSIPFELTGPDDVGTGFRPYHRFTATFEGAGGARLRQRRDILRVGEVVGVLAHDPQAGCFVFIRQFRLGAQLATGAGELVEIAAGLIDPGEDADAAARRECVEEIGVAPRALLPIARFLPTPGVTDEYATIYLGLVDSSLVPDVAGEPGETELDAALPGAGGGRAGEPCRAFSRPFCQWLRADRAAMVRVEPGAGERLRRGEWLETAHGAQWRA